MKIKILYHDKNMPKLQHIGGRERSNWIDVRACSININGKDVNWDENNQIKYKTGDFLIIDLGFSLEMPDDCEGYLLPRSSTFKNFGFILVNSMGVVDSSYKGKDDHWKFQAYALRDGVINKYDRIGQFRIVKSMEAIDFEEKTEEEWLHENRNGIGSSGTK